MKVASCHVVPCPYLASCRPLRLTSLTLCLKPCFLYITAFPEDSEIDVSKLIKLWVAEGFLKLCEQSKCLEDVGERYLEDLVRRSLIFVRKKGLDGKLETVGIHDLLRGICIIKAEEEGFLHHVSSKRNARKGTVENPNRHLNIHFQRIVRILDSSVRSVLFFYKTHLSSRSSISCRRLSIHYPPTFREWQRVNSSIRSVLLFYESQFPSRLSLSCRRLSILDAPEVTWRNFSDVISTFVNLRYIAFALNDITCPRGFPSSISKLSNLQTVIVHVNYSRPDSSLQVPYEILEMPKLRHLIMNCPFRLSYPSQIGVIRESDIQTLVTVIDFRFTEEAIKLLVNLKKLKVVFKMYNDNWDDFILDNLFRLQNLEELEVYVFCLSIRSRIWNHTFPISLRKLSLTGVPFRWENMSMIGSLPNLQVLEMLNMKVTKVSNWTPLEGQFLRLKYFCSTLDYLVKWEVEKEHFPSLECLILEDVHWIDEIPCGIGEIDSLQLIELKFCSELLVNSAKLIQEQQHENGNDDFQVHDFDSYE